MDTTLCPIDSSDNRHTRPSWLFVLVVFALGWVVQLALYTPIFRVLPAGDDFPMLREIQRGNEQGAWALIRVSGSEQNYRPIKSLGLWAFGNISPTNRVFWIHVLHYGSATALALITLLWMRTAPLGHAGVIASVLVIFLHPGLVASIGSLDGFDSSLSTCFIWLGAWFIYRFRNKVILSYALACACFLIGGVTKEYAFSLVPLGTWTIFHFTERKRFSRAAGLAIVLMCCFALLMVIRKITVPPGFNQGLFYLSFDPGQWASNLTLFLVGVLLPGNTVWVFLNRFSPLMLIAFPLIGTLCGIIFGGAWKYWEEKSTKHQWMTYLAVSTGVAMFPMIVMFHISEMYLPPLIVPFALLCGIAADGWRRYSLPAQLAVGVVSLAMLGNGVWAIHSKIAGLRLVGDRTELQMNQLLTVLPETAKNARIAIAYNTFGMKPNRHYSVFAMGDEIMLVHANVLDWKVPQRTLQIETFPNSMTPPAEDAKYDYYVFWDHRNDRMILSKREDLWR